MTEGGGLTLRARRVSGLRPDHAVAGQVESQLVGDEHVERVAGEDRQILAVGGHEIGKARVVAVGAAPVAVAIHEAGAEVAGGFHHLRVRPGQADEARVLRVDIA